MSPPFGVYPNPWDPQTPPHGPLVLYSTQVIPKLEVQALRVVPDPGRDGLKTLWEEWIILSHPFMARGEDQRRHLYVWVESSEERDRNAPFEGPVFRNPQRKMVRLSDYGIHRPWGRRRFGGYQSCVIIVRYRRFSRAELRVRQQK